ncbi:MAG: radical SAM protein [Chitinivibrionales bacterium]|jgi:molybdenum cofactor biosynthesis enzyme MoaA|nr:radical SAM protein [Chitinivibrionales bacterium]
MLKNIFAKSNKKIIEKKPQKYLKYFAVPIVEHCNLKCRFCDHFAPLAEQEFADIKIFEKDFARLSELLNAKVDFISLMGGEPLLHPQLNDFLYIARKYFPKTELRIVTNGILLLKQTEDFWKACKDNSIIIVNTKYPIPLDFDKIKEEAKKHDVKFEHYGDSEDVLKTSTKTPLDLKGKQNMNTNFYNIL